MEKIYMNRDEYKVVFQNIIGSGYESNVFACGEYVIKHLQSEFRTLETKKRIEYLSDHQELEKYITIPLAKIYRDKRFVAYLMKYAGINLKDELLENDISLDKKIEYLLKVKECIEAIHKAGFIHGDIQAKNILILNDDVKLCDVNNIKTKFYYTPLLNDLTLYLAKYYGIREELDIIAFNYLAYILLNFDYEELKKLLYLDAEGYTLFNEKYYQNKIFDNEVCKEQMNILNHPVKVRKKQPLNTKYLIDYLK